MKKMLIVIFLIMGIASCLMPVSGAVLSINPGDSVQRAVSSAGSGDTIVLNPGTYYENGITITAKNLILQAADGHGPADTIIDGRSAAPRIFTVTDVSSLTIKNLALRNSRAGNGGSGGDDWLSDGGNGNHGGNGGAISTGGPVTIISSTIAGCSAGKGGNGGKGGIWVGSDGGNGGNGGHGGAIYSTGSVTLTSSAITDCTAGKAGNAGDDGGLGTRGNVGYAGHGGAIYSTGIVTLTSSTIAGCSAGNGGGGAETRTSSNGGYGGAIYSTGSVTLTSSAITDCTAGNGALSPGAGIGGNGGHGGAIYSTGSVTLTSSAIAGCSAGNGGNGFSMSGQITGNGGFGGNGGAIFADGGNVGIIASTVTDCSAGNGGSGSDAQWPALGLDGGHGRPGGDGGAIFATDNVALVSTTITNCRAGTGGKGGKSGTWGDRGHTGRNGNGGAIYALSGIIHYCRLVNDNIPDKAVHSSGGTIDATNTWWGSNSNPSALAGGPTTYSPWLVLGVRASPVYITTAETSVIEANLTYDSAGRYHDPSGQKVPFTFPDNLLAPFSHVPDTIPVSYAVTSGSGSVSPGSAVMKSGKSLTLFKPSSGRPASVTATVDGQAVSAIINSIDPIALPAIMAVSPLSGPSSGGTRVTLSGTGFTGATGVMFGDNRASFSATGDSIITATSPGGTAGTVDITVATPYGTSRVVAADRFTYLPVPTPLPTTLPTTVPTTMPTTRPVPSNIVGCWEMAHYDGNTRTAYRYNLQSDGSGWMNGTRTTSEASESVSERIRWTMEPASSRVTITEADPRDDFEPDKWVLIYDEKKNILDGGEKGHVVLIFKRVPCNPVG